MNNPIMLSKLRTAVYLVDYLRSYLDLEDYEKYQELMDFLRRIDEATEQQSSITSTAQETTMSASKYALDFIPTCLVSSVAQATGHDFEVVDNIIKELQSQAADQHKKIRLAEIKRSVISRLTNEEREALGL